MKKLCFLISLLLLTLLYACDYGGTNSGGGTYNQPFEQPWGVVGT